MDGRAISFGPYRLLAPQRLLLEGDKPVRLGGRAFDILTALIERAGEVISKEELIARAWPETYVEEANLKIQVSALRRALGDGQGDNRYVVTVVGRGYNFVAPIRQEEPSRASPSPTIATAALHNLPFATTRMIGREEIVTTLVTRLSHERLVTIVGPGGVGKTTVALAVAERMIGAYEGVWLVDLAPLGDPGLVPSAVATVLRLQIRTEDPLPGLVAALRDSRMLLILDNCEHLINAAAGLTATVVSGAPGVTILATSREPLGVPGERVHRLGPLGSPEPSSTLTAAEVAAFPAVQLFVERVTAIVEDFALTNANAPLVGAICRRLDGLPLAIEFAAPRVEALGIATLAARLDDSLRSLAAQRRTAMPRHRTMQAVVDWSYGLLSQDEQRSFRALGIFRGGFTREAAAAIAMDAATTGSDAIGRLADLVAKSLVAADVSGARPRFRLLDTTRAFALEKLDASGEREAIAHLHAEYYRRLVARAVAEASAQTTGDLLADAAEEIDNLRSALDWAFSPAGDAAIGITLTAACAPLWIKLSLLGECVARVEKALLTLGRDHALGSETEMHLKAALGMSLMYTRGPIDETDATWARVLELAGLAGNKDYQLRALYGLWLYKILICEYRAALQLARQFRIVAERGAATADIAVADRLIGTALHFLGDQAETRACMTRCLSALAPGNRHDHTTHFGADQRVVAYGLLARALWLQGFPDQAISAAQASVDEATAVGHANSMCLALADGASVIATLVDNAADIERFGMMLTEHAEKHALGVWRTYGAALRGRLLTGRGAASTGAALLMSALADLRETPLDIRYQLYLVWFALALRTAGKFAEALAAVDEALERAERTEERWYLPELLRIRGELLLGAGDSSSAVAAGECFATALDWARRQETLSWELRAATSLARLLRKQGHSDDAVAVLRPVYNRLTEGFGTADLVAAKQLLDKLGTPDHD